MRVKLIIAGVVLVLLAVITPMLVGINDAGYRTVIQFLNGNLDVKFGAGWYMKWFGETTKYKDVITFDFDRNKNGAGGTLDEPGIGVRYQDGGTGTIYGLVRFRLPTDKVDMLKIHKDFRSNRGLAYKLFKNTTEEIMNQTAGLMTSEDSYANKRSTYTQWAEDQLENGKYVTKTKTITTTENGMDNCLDDGGDVKNTDECKSVKTTTREIPVISYKGGMPQHLSSDLKDYNISISTFNIIDWTYEKKTLEQIAAKRQATMAIITAKANAERAKQDALTAEQEGLAKVVQAKYEKEVDKQKAIVEAEQQKEVAVIAAQQQVEVAKQQVQAATQNKLAALQEKARQIALGEGEAARKKLVMAADGALQAKLDAYIKVNKNYADAIAAYKGNWVPSVMLASASSGHGGSDGAQQLIQLLSVKTAKDLALDTSVVGKSMRQAQRDDSNVRISN